MNRLGFHLARLARNEAALQRLSVSLSVARHFVDGQTVALVGNARSLSETLHGNEIDAADIVIRINRAPMPSARSHGTRTDVLALATAIPEADLQRLQPRRIWWMSHKRKRLTWPIATSQGFYMPGLDAFHSLRIELGAPPTTGLMLLNWLSLSGARSVSLYGFDFFASLSLSGRRTAAQVPHDFTAERRFVDALLEKDPRFRLIAAT